MSFTKDTMKSFRNDFAEAVAEIEKKYNMKLSLGNIGFDAGSFRTRIIGTSCDASAVEEKKDYLNPQINSYAKMYGIPFKDNLIGSTYRVAGKILTVKDYKSSNHKYPIVCSGSDGKSYKISFDHLKTATLI